MISFFGNKPIEISDLNSPEILLFNQSREVNLFRINEPKLGIFICESAKVIARALEAGYEMISVLTSIENPEKDADTRMVFENCTDVPIYFGKEELLRQITGYALTGGLLAAMKRKELAPAGEILAGKRIIAVLENVQNPTNVGSIFRSAAAMGIEAILLTSDSSDPLYRRAERVSMGTVFQIPWTKIDKDQDYISILSDYGFATVAMALSNQAVNISDPAIKREDKLAIILGNEGYGLSDDTISRSSYVAMIPMNPIVDSLNVGAASAVMFWEMTRDLLIR